MNKESDFDTSDRTMRRLISHSEIRAALDAEKQRIARCQPRSSTKQSTCMNTEKGRPL